MTRKALIIEDDEPTQFLLRQIAEIDGWECRHGTTFAAGLEWAEWADVILLDLTLEGPSGVDMIPALRTVSPGTHIIVITGDEDACAAAIGAGADAFITKPFEVLAVHRAMRAGAVIDLRELDDDHDRLPWFASN